MAARPDEFPAAAPGDGPTPTPVPAPVPAPGDGPTPIPEPPRDPGAGLPDPTKVGTAKFTVDVLERAVATYLEVFLGLLVAADKLDIKYTTAALVAAVPTGLAVIKAGVSRFLGDKGSAAFLPRRFLKRDFNKAA